METSHIGMIITVTLAWSGFLIGVIKYLLDRNMASAERIIGLQDEKINALAIEIKKNSEELARLREELPTVYTRKEDCRNNQESWIREMMALEHKFTAQFERLHDKIDELKKELYKRNA